MKLLGLLLIAGCFALAAAVGVRVVEQAHADAPRTLARVQGRGVAWWSRRAVQARKDANKRGLTIVRQRRLLRTERRLIRRVIRSQPYGNHWLDSAFLCIHAGEGSWDAATGNGYSGGLQMDADFQRTYGPEFLAAFGPADRWPVSVQIAVGVRGWLARGFRPWPTTARNCGL